MKISEILTKYAYKSDCEHGTDKNRCKKHGHCYGLAYDNIFKHFDKNAELDLIEIGTEFGGSLIAWKEFFPNANVTGIDIEDKVEKKRENIKYVISDVKNFKPEKEYDIVIDDGSHRLSDVVYTVKNFKLKPEGVMIIEDCQAPEHWFEKIRKNTNYSIELIDLRELYKQPDDFLIILRNYGYRKN